MMDTEKKDKVSIVVHGGDTGKMYSDLIIGNGAMVMGMGVSLFFAF